LLPAVERAALTEPLARLCDFRAHRARFAGNYDEAVALYEQAVELWTAVGRSERVAYCTTVLGTISYTLRDRARGDALYARALELYEALGDPDGVAHVLRRQAVGLHDAGQYESSIALCTRALSLLGVRFPERRGQVQTSLGHSLRELGRVDEAERAFASALRLYQAVGSVDALLARVNLGLCQLERRDWATARATLEAALEGMLQVTRGRFNPTVCVVNGLLLPCLAQAADWTAFERAFEDASALTTGSPYLARWAERAADFCPAERAREVLELARLNWEREGRSGDVRRVAERLAGSGLPSSAGPP
jgi:tetratricopeptide (TPR) repeat protein